jgi:hypothetical protein
MGAATPRGPAPVRPTGLQLPSTRAAVRQVHQGAIRALLGPVPLPKVGCVVAGGVLPSGVVQAGRTIGQYSWVIQLGGTVRLYGLVIQLQLAGTSGMYNWAVQLDRHTVGQYK